VESIEALQPSVGPPSFPWVAIEDELAYLCAIEQLRLYGQHDLFDAERLQQPYLSAVSLEVVSPRSSDRL
jgi:hypothetical protein